MHYERVASMPAFRKGKSGCLNKGLGFETFSGLLFFSEFDSQSKFGRVTAYIWVVCIVSWTFWKYGCVDLSFWKYDCVELSERRPFSRFVCIVSWTFWKYGCIELSESMVALIFLKVWLRWSFWKYDCVELSESMVALIFLSERMIVLNFSERKAYLSL